MSSKKNKSPPLGFLLLSLNKLQDIWRKHRNYSYLKSTLSPYAKSSEEITLKSAFFLWSNVVFKTHFELSPIRSFNSSRINFICLLLSNIVKLYTAIR